MKLEKLTHICIRITGYSKLIKHFNYKSGIEVGVREANFSKSFLDNTSLEQLIGIDCNYCPNAIKLEVQYPNRYKFICASSPECTTGFSNESFDFIHIDADHHYQAVKEDLNAWYPKVKSGGCLSGDDYMKFTDIGCEGEFGVMQAVNEFVTEQKLQLYIIGCPYTDINVLTQYGNFVGNNLTEHRKGNGPFMFSGSPNWYIIKP